MGNSSLTVDRGLPRSDDGCCTYFAPAGRESAETLQQQAGLFHNVVLLQPTLDAMPSWVLILNAKRQIVAANHAMLNVLGVTMPGVLGKRPGEAVFCRYAPEGPDGCGTTLHCVTCGAVGAILESWQEGVRVTRECRVLLAVGPGAAMDLRVTASPIELSGQRFIVFAVEEISDESAWPPFRTPSFTTC